MNAHQDRCLLLTRPEHDERLLPVKRSPRVATLAMASRVFRTMMDSRKEKEVNTAIVAEFKNKLRLAEEMISKLAFSLGEIQGMRGSSKSTQDSTNPDAPMTKRGRMLQFRRD